MRLSLQLIKKRKGSIFDTIVLLIIFVIVLALLMIFVNKYGEFMKNSLEKGLCKQSVRAYERLGLKGTNFFTSIKCPTEYIVVKKDEDIKEKLAYYAGRCWNNFYEGRPQLFDEPSLKALKKKNFCVICSHITFEKKTKISARDFLEYLKNTEIPKEFTSEPYNVEVEGTRYYTYLTRYREEELNPSHKDLEESNIDTNFPYAVVLTYANKGHLNRIFPIAVGTTALAGVIVAKPLTRIPYVGYIALLIGAGVGTVVGIVEVAPTVGGITTKHDTGIALVPYEAGSLKSLECDYLPIKQEEKKKKNEK